MLNSALHSTCGFLLVAQPQSSSTATLEQLSMMASLRAKQTLPCKPNLKLATCERSSKDYPCLIPNTSVFWPLAQPTNGGFSDMCEHNLRSVEKWVRDRKTLYKQHIHPSARHAAAIVLAARKSRLTRVVILTRDVSSSAHARCERNLHPFLGELHTARHSPRSGMAKTSPSSIETLQAHAAWQRGLVEWQQGWQQAAAAAPDVFWTFTYEQMQAGNRRPYLQRALQELNLTQARDFVDTRARLVNKSDAECEFAKGAS